MLKFIKEIAGLFETVFEFFVSFVESLYMALKFIITSGPFNVLVTGMVPTIIGTCMTIVIAIAIAKFLLGR